MFYFKLAARNLLKNFRRTVMTLSAVAVGMIACILAQGFINYSLTGLRESIINGGMGHFQIYKKGFSENGIDEPFNYMIKGYKKIFREISTVPGIKVMTPRLSYVGLLSNSEKNIRIMGAGGWVDEEKQLNSFSDLKAGKFISDEKPSGILVGSGVAKKLSAKPGDSLTLSLPMDGGGYNAVDVEVAGILNAQIKELDDVLAITNLEMTQNAMNIPKSVDKIIIILKNTNDMAKIEPIIKAICEKNGLEYKTWLQLAGIQYEQPKLFYNMVFVIMMTIIVLVALFSITNTVQINVFERIREIGTIRAVGTTRSQVMKIFLAEGFLIGIIGGIIGIIIGYLIAQMINLGGGIPIPPPPGNTKGYQAFIWPDFILVLKHEAVFLITAILAVIYPAKKAAKMEITEALRWI